MPDKKLDRLNDDIRSLCRETLRTHASASLTVKELEKLSDDLNMSIARLCETAGVEGPLVKIVHLPNGLQLRVVQSGRVSPE